MASRPRGLYGAPRRTFGGRQLALIALLAAVVAIGLFLAFRSCGGTSCDEIYCPSSEDIATPPGHERVSNIFALRAGENGKADPNTQPQITVPLTKSTSDGRNLSFFQYNPKTKAWEPLAPAVLDAQGKHASVTLNALPQYLAVMRRDSAAGSVVAYLPHGAALHPEAAGKVTIVHSRDFTPAADGTISGELTPPAATGAKTDGSVAFYPTITADGSDPASVATVATILSSAANRSNHVQAIVKLAADKGLGGVDIAYTALTADQRSSFALFITELGQALKGQNKMLTVTLPPPLKTQDRVDEGAYDWQQIGAAADLVQIAPYRDQSTYRRNMPDILAYLVTKVQPNKLVLTVTPYATEKSPEQVRPLLLSEAMIIATQLSVQGQGQALIAGSNVNIVGPNIDQASGRSGIAWQPETACVAFTYEQNGGRTVWIENTFSVSFKLELIPKYGLGGVAVEDASAALGLGDIWPALVPFLSSGQPVLNQPNPADLKPQWTVSGGTKETESKGSLKWALPDTPGNYTVSLTLSDGVARFENTITVTVQAKPASPTPAPTQAN